MTDSATEAIDAWLAAWPGATTPRARATEERISRTAQILTVERGLDGFTMDELAEATGVSRRTLFNHFGTKVDAVLGNPPPLTRDLFAEFTHADHRGPLLRDLGRLIAVILASDPNAIEDARRLPALMAEPKLMQAATERFADVAERIASLAALRGDELTPRQSRLAVLVLAGVAHEAFTIVVNDPGHDDVSALYLELLDDTLALMG